METGIMLGLMFAGIGVPIAAWGIWDSWLSHKREMAEKQYGQSNREAQLAQDKEELKDTVAMLQDRLAVLETIATDPARRTADEIEKLR